LLNAMTVSRTASPVGLVTALQQEFSTVRKCLGADCESFALVQSGMGRAAGYIAAEAMGRQHHGRLAGLVSMGFCGALAHGLPTGSVVVPAQVITAEDETAFEADRTWRAAVLERLAGMTPRDGALYSARDVISTASDKQAIATRAQAIAVDMESAGIAHAARRLNVPFLAIRIVLDEAEDALPRATADAVKPDGNLDMRGLMRGLAHNPRDIPALMALGRKSSTAQGRLKAVCEALKPDFCRLHRPEH
jgi:adenosylhomocysteine nucleosidase